MARLTIADATLGTASLSQAVQGLESKLVRGLPLPEPLPGVLNAGDRKRRAGLACDRGVARRLLKLSNSLALSENHRETINSKRRIVLAPELSRWDRGIRCGGIPRQRQLAGERSR